MDDRVYLHETIDIIGANRADYNHHMTANFGHIARIERGLLCMGVFSTVGSTEQWPQTMNLWEFQGSWDGVARNFRHEFSTPTHQDASLAPWWRDAAGLTQRRLRPTVGGRRLVPTLAQLLTANNPAECHYHELVALVPGSAADYLEAVRIERVALAAEFGWSLVGAWRTALVNDSEAVLVWSIPTWEQWGAWEAAQAPGAGRHPGVTAWRSGTAAMVRDWRSKLMVASELSPLVTGELL